MSDTARICYANFGAYGIHLYVTVADWLERLAIRKVAIRVSTWSVDV